MRSLKWFYGYCQRRLFFVIVLVCDGTSILMGVSGSIGGHEGHAIVSYGVVSLRRYHGRTTIAVAYGMVELLLLYRMQWLWSITTIGWHCLTGDHRFEKIGFYRRENLLQISDKLKEAGTVPIDGPFVMWSDVGRIVHPSFVFESEGCSVNYEVVSLFGVFGG